MPRAKTPTHQSVTHVLLEAGFTKSQERRGSPIADGFAVRSGGEGKVRVHHVIAQRGPADTDARFRARWEERYAEAIEAAGYAAERGTGGHFSPIVVTAKDAQKGDQG